MSRTTETEASLAHGAVSPARPPAPPHLSDQGLLEPLAVTTERLLRRLVLDHVMSERRRRHTPLLHVGRPTGEQVAAHTLHAIRPEDDADHALRTDVVAAMVRRVGASTAPIVWLTRSGSDDLEDLDADWLAGSAQAFAEAGLPLVFVIVGRHGWRDPRSGLQRSWVRLRPRRLPNR